MQALPRTFETERLIARLPRAADAALLFASYTSDPKVGRYLMWTPHQSVAETERFISDCIAAVEAGTRFPYVLATREQPNDPIGMLEARASQHTVDLGYVLAPKYWGQGLMPEAVRGLTEWALSQERFYRVQAFCDVENKASQRTLEKAGFAQEGRHERYVVHPNLSPEPRACYMYGRCR
ncbi:RimJ/RimL family protein N-acetyltransferase [Hydrogenophaga palleronii]|uniref:RimJ/RimL family protein N-acetyltransferase n=1 Tax=Hydrogenophaga palleronii TaxID=65655 RepID=A0ABU1WPP7_9BURK|nr:GNAT family N-acetyltransferase [Hydrogenophaga palleronii]MDR7151270.1 RimJ/RimL family protein N-acetyltransferase [Hydrogenophaga palleronii]